MAIGISFRQLTLASSTCRFQRARSQQSNASAPISWELTTLRTRVRLLVKLRKTRTNVKRRMLWVWNRSRVRCLPPLLRTSRLTLCIMCQLQSSYWMILSRRGGDHQRAAEVRHTVWCSLRIFQVIMGREACIYRRTGCQILHLCHH